MSIIFSRQFEHFAHLHEAGNFRVAAERAGISQPALTRSIAALEARIGMPLFERTSRGAVPTHAGDALWRHAAKLTRQARQAELEMGILRDGTGGQVRIGTGIVADRVVTPRIVARFHASYPRIGVSVVTAITEALLPQMTVGELDLVVSDLHEVVVPPGFEAERLRRSARRLWMRRGHPLDGAACVDWADVARFGWIGHPADTRAERPIARRFRAIGLAPPPSIVEASSISMFLGVAAETDLIALLADELAVEARGRGLVALPLDEPIMTLETGILYRSSTMDMKPFRDLRDLARAALGGEPP